MPHSISIPAQCSGNRTWVTQTKTRGGLERFGQCPEFYFLKTSMRYFHKDWLHLDRNVCYTSTSCVHVFTWCACTCMCTLMNRTLITNLSDQSEHMLKDSWRTNLIWLIHEGVSHLWQKVIHKRINRTDRQKLPEFNIDFWLKPINNMASYELSVKSILVCSFQ